MKKKNKKMSIPARFLSPIRKVLERELARLKKTRTSLKKADPFNDAARVSENSLEEDVDEQIGHFDTEIKVKFLGRQIIQFRKALARMKIGKYGVCEKCGKMIDTDRLAINPEATTCVKCEKEKEL